MTYAAIMSVADNRVAKFKEFETRKEANAHVAAFAEKWPDAFVTKAPAANVSDWWVDGKSVTVVPTVPPLALYQEAISNHVNAAARARRYDDAVSLASYVNSTIPQWAAEATAFVAWRDAVWAYAYAELDKVEAGQRPVPTVAEFLEELPAIGADVEAIRAPA